MGGGNEERGRGFNHVEGSLSSALPSATIHSHDPCTIVQSMRAARPVAIPRVCTQRGWDMHSMERMDEGRGKDFERVSSGTSEASEVRRRGLNKRKGSPGYAWRKGGECVCVW